jgi:hypothetical protein
MQAHRSVSTPLQQTKTASIRRSGVRATFVHGDLETGLPPRAVYAMLLREAEAARTPRDS